MLFDYVETYHYMSIHHLHPKYNHDYMNRKNFPERSYITENSLDTNQDQLLREGIKYRLYTVLAGLHLFGARGVQTDVVVNSVYNYITLFSRVYCVWLPLYKQFRYESPLIYQ